MLVGKPEGNRPVRRLRHGWEKILKWILRNGTVGVVWSHLAQNGSVAGCCWYRSERLYSINGNVMTSRAAANFSEQTLLWFIHLASQVTAWGRNCICTYVTCFITTQVWNVTSICCNHSMYRPCIRDRSIRVVKVTVWLTVSWSVRLGVSPFWGSWPDLGTVWQLRFCRSLVLPLWFVIVIVRLLSIQN
jgi:hypothetical protein